MQITARKFTPSLLSHRSRKGFFEVPNVAFHSNNQWRSSSVAVVSSDSFNSQQGKKRRCMQKRSAMVLAFVEKYRYSNGGKFPSATYTQKQIGGSYYVTRSIIQKLEYNYKRGFLETKQEVKNREENAKCEAVLSTKQPRIAADVNKNFEGYVGDDSEIRQKHPSNKSKAGTKTSQFSITTHSDNQTEINAHKQLNTGISRKSPEDKYSGFDKFRSSPSATATMKPQTQTSSAFSDTEAMHVENRVSPKLENETIILHTLTEEREASVKEVGFAAILRDATSSQGKKLSSGEAFRSEKIYRKRERPGHGVETTNSSSLWINLKSMAVGIINLWKKK